jgi:tripartite ATP-independent transporter DctM subunit
MMDWNALIVIGVLLLAFLAMGFHIAFALGLAGIVSFLLFVPGQSAFAMPGLIAWSSTNNFVMSCIPLFILMAELLLVSGLTEDIFNAISAWLGRIPGSLLLSSVFACAVFAACSGSSSATVAAIGGPSGPEMIKRKYSRTLTYGTLCTGGTLGILIPPSIPMVIYCQMTGESVGKLFMAGIVPGILLTLIFAAYIFIRASINPKLAPKSPPVPFQQALSYTVKSLPLFIVIFAVLGTIYMGIATPTEAAALGAVASLCIALLRRRLTKTNFLGALRGTAVTSAMLLTLLAMAAIFASVIIKLRFASTLVELIGASGFGVWTVLILLYLLYFVLGMFIDPIAMIVLTLPVAVPVLQSFGVDLIWFGVIVVVMIETALLTPPVGTNLFVMQGIAPDTNMTELTKGVLPYVALIFLFFLPLLNFFPQIATWLPNTMR